MFSETVPLAFPTQAVSGEGEVESTGGVEATIGGAEEGTGREVTTLRIKRS